MSNRLLSILFLSCLLLAGACVSTKKYDAALKSAADAQHQRDAERAAHNAALGEANTKIKKLEAGLDGSTAENAGLRAELERLGTNVDQLLAEKGSLAGALRDSRARLEELRRARAAADARVRLYRELALRLKQMVDAGSLSIALREGRMVLQLSNDVLFDTGKTEIKAEGQKALRQIAAVLKTLEGRKFHVGGHTDNVPIATARFPSNWELSAARGLAVLHLLIAEGVPPTSVAAEGYGEFDPVASNDDAAGRAKNRRMEIALQPHVDELVSVPDM